MRILLFLALLTLFPAVLKAEKNLEKDIKDKGFTTSDFIYESSIKTVTLFPNTGNVSDFLKPAIVPISQSPRLLLTFDDIKEYSESYYVKIIHCNADWTISTLSEIQYLYDFNEFFISDRQNSIATLVPFVHYRFTIPKVKISGNFVIKVYRDYDEEDLILTKRFMVYEQGNKALDVNTNVRFARSVSERNESQQVDFTISYGKLNLVNPAMNLKVVIRQNFRWDNAIYNLAPLYVKEFEKRLEYNYFNMENGFKGGNEFNAFDISSFLTYRLNIGKIVLEPEFYEIFLLTDIARKSKSYFQYPDIDGMYWVEHYETGDRALNADYGLVNFYLEVPPQNGDIYINGTITNWNLDPAFKMQYDQALQKYTARVLLKQGYYNYTYSLVNSKFPKGNEIIFSGSHNQTQNQYDIMVYYREPGQRADKLIGYTAVNFMERR